MNALLQYMPFKNGHFRWCASSGSEEKRSRAGCASCKSALYLTALFATTGVALLEFWGGMMTQSLALISDAWHMVFDSLGYLIGFLAILFATVFRYSEKDTARNMRYSEFVMALFMGAAAFGVCWEAIGRFSADQAPVIIENGWLLAIASIGLGINVGLLVLFRALRVTHTHTHAPTHGSADSEVLGEAGTFSLHGEDAILEANIMHTLGDALSSVLVLGNAILFRFTADSQLRYLDLVAAFFIGLLLVYQSVKMLRPHRPHPA